MLSGTRAPAAWCLRFRGRGRATVASAGCKCPRQRAGARASCLACSHGRVCPAPAAPLLKSCVATASPGKAAVASSSMGNVPTSMTRARAAMRCCINGCASSCGNGRETERARQQSVEQAAGPAACSCSTSASRRFGARKPHVRTGAPQKAAGRGHSAMSTTCVSSAMVGGSAHVVPWAKGIKSLAALAARSASRKAPATPGCGVCSNSSAVPTPMARIEGGAISRMRSAGTSQFLGGCGRRAWHEGGWSPATLHAAAKQLKP